jgi:hypothetical protein
MQQSKKMILDTKSGGAGGNMIYLPLDKLLERNAARPAAGATTGAPSAEELPTVTIDGRNRGVR